MKDSQETKRRFKDCLRVAVIGGGNCSKAVAKTAETVGAELARKGAIVICGGLGGVMEAVCRGAHSQGGLTLGILPGSRPEDANPHVDFAIATSLGQARNMVVVKSAAAVIAIDGEYGTLSEIAFALNSGIPVISLGSWSLFKNGKKDESIIEAETPQEAVALAFELGSVLKRG